MSKSGLPVARIHASAEVSADAVLGLGVIVWNQAQIREGATIGENTIIGKNVYVDAHVHIGARCKIQNNVSVYHGVDIQDGVFLGPHVCFTNDLLPRAINPDGSLKGSADWHVSRTLIKTGASIGANAVILSGLAIGRFAMVGAGSVVTRSVPDHGLVMGNPARLAGYACVCGARLSSMRKGDADDPDVPKGSTVEPGVYRCGVCGFVVTLD